MRAVILALACSLLSSVAAGGVATIDNTAEAKALYAVADLIPVGDYLIENVDDDDKALRNDNSGGPSRSSRADNKG